MWTGEVYTSNVYFLGDLSMKKFLLSVAFVAIAGLAMLPADAKAFGDKQFAYLRDLLTGYSLVKRHHPTYALPAYIV